MKRILVLMVVIAFTHFGYSQGLDFGIKAGTDIHKMSGKSFDEEFKFGYHVGAFAEIKLNKVGIQPEVYFSQVNVDRGTQPSAVWNSNNIKNAKLSYLNIPILVNLKFNDNVALQVGPQYGRLLNESAKNDIVGTGRETFKSGDFSLTGGLQVKISKIRLYGRYNIGLNNVNDVTSQEKWKTQTIHAGISYAIF